MGITRHEPNGDELISSCTFAEHMSTFDIHCVKDLLALPAVDVENCTYLQLNKTRFKQWWMWPVDGDRAEPPDSFHLNIFLNVKSRRFF